MKYSVELITATTYSPISIGGVKAALRIDNTSQDDVIQMAVDSAEFEAEKRSGHLFAQRELRVSFDELETLMDFPINPIYEVVSVEYWDGSSWTAFTDYEVDLNAKPPVFWFKSFPTVGEKLKPYRIQVKAGYESTNGTPDADQVPKDAIMAMTFYACQHVIYTGEISERATKAFRMMLSPFKVMKL